MGRGKKLFLLGSLLGAGLVWLNTTKKGKEVRDQALDHADELFEKVKKRVGDSETWEKMTKTKFGALVAEMADEYSRERGLSENVKRIVTRVVASQWGALRRTLKKRK